MSDGFSIITLSFVAMTTFSFFLGKALQKTLPLESKILKIQTQCVSQSDHYLPQRL